MIEFNCPKCGEAMSSPDSMAGESEACPACANVCTVPQKPMVSHMGASRPPWRRRWRPMLSGVGRFARRRRKWLAIGTVNLIVLTGALSFLLPRWLPRPGVRFETDPGHGLFPDRAEMDRFLTDRGYYLVRAIPLIGVLRGRRLAYYIYARDVNHADWAWFKVWCPLEDNSKVIALTTELNSEMINRLAGTILGAGCEAATRFHASRMPSVISHFCGIDYRSIDLSSANRLQLEGSPGRSFRRAWRKTRGFELQCLEESTDDQNIMRRPQLLVVHILVKDKSWPDLAEP